MHRSILGGTWTCHICKEERPDELIAVHTEKIASRLGPVSAHVRYCKDNPACQQAAPALADHWLGPWRRKKSAV